MLTLRCVRKSRAFLSPSSPPPPISIIQSDLVLFYFYSSTAANASNSSTITSSATPAAIGYPSYPFAPSMSESLRVPEEQAKAVVMSFREWFRARNNILFDRIFKILGTHGEASESDTALSRLGLRLSESLVLEVLNYGKDVLSCLKFFDWAGRQPGFHHTRATFNAIFKILSRAKLMSLMLDFLENYSKQRYFHRVRFYDTLVMGYAVAGKPEIALQLFGRMRFLGIDLDGFAYHVLLNALVEEGCFDLVEMVVKQIRTRGFESEITHSILVKNFCKQKHLDEAECYLRKMVNSGVALNGHVVGVVVDALCKDNQFEKAGRLVEEFRETGVAQIEYAYDIWIKDLVQAGKLDGALEFFQSKKAVDGYVPDVFRYNMLICRLLRENRLHEVCDLLIEMKELEISPDDVTMNAVLCFFCKAGMVDVAVELYDSRAELGISPSSMAYNYMINTLCGDGSIDEAYRVLKNSIDQGYFPGKKTFSILADALCREGKLDKMKDLVLVALKRNYTPSSSIYNQFISALCRANRVEDGYSVHVNRSNKVTSKYTYFNLISGFSFNNSNRGDIAASLLIEMQEKGHVPSRKLFRAVIRCVCDMENPEKQFLQLLGMQLSRCEPDYMTFKNFIDGAGHARKPELAKQVYEMMSRSGIAPNLSSDISMLQSYLKSGRISDALNFFRDLSKRRKIGRKLCHTMIVGLCKANKPDLALDFLSEMRDIDFKPSLQCYEELVKLLCEHRRYYTVVHLIDDLLKVGRPLSTFIGNVLLFNSLRSKDLFKAWGDSRDVQDLTPRSLIVGKLIGIFCDFIEVNEDIEDIEELIGQCFPLDIYTYNMLLRRMSMSEMEHACALFNRLYQKGFEPNRWTYDILVHGFFKHKRTAEANRWMEEMFRKGFEPTAATKLLI